MLALAVGPAAARDLPSPDEVSPAEARARAANANAPPDPDEEGLRQRLTEREDRRRPPDPWDMEVAGRPLTVSGEYEFALGRIRRFVLGGERPRERDRLLLEQELEVEAFYAFDSGLAVFVQGRIGMEEDLHGGGVDPVADRFVERGEMWLYTEEIAGLPIFVDVGRLDYEDDRRWWWDDELDALRMGVELERVDLELSLARELAPTRSDRDRIDPEHDRVVRVIAEFSIDLAQEHGFEIFALHADDHSRTEAVGRIVNVEREDESDAELTWIGARLSGVFDLGQTGILGYWLDGAHVRGEERLLRFEEISPWRSEVEEVLRRDVRGFALDVGASWILPGRFEPRLFAGYAFGSGDDTPEEGTSRAFRQTGLHANEPGFGGVERFSGYGILLQPELSNLHVGTLGVGFSVLRSSSLDLVYHYYRLDEPAEGLRDALPEIELDGRHRDLGHGFDVLLALEEWTYVEGEVAFSLLRAGRAFGHARGDWSWGLFAALRIGF